MDIKNLKRTEWSKVRDGDEVFLLAKHPPFVGPFIVVSTETRTLRNKRGRVFFHYPEELLKEIRNETIKDCGRNKCY